jgi:DNA-binding NtrC family response regulator
VCTSFIERPPQSITQGASGAVGVPHRSAQTSSRILDALEACRGDQTRAAAMLDMPRRTFVIRLEEYGIPCPRKDRRE